MSAALNVVIFVVLSRFCLSVFITCSTWPVRLRSDDWLGKTRTFLCLALNAIMAVMEGRESLCTHGFKDFSSETHVTISLIFPAVILFSLFVCRLMCIFSWNNTSLCGRHSWLQLYEEAGYKLSQKKETIDRLFTEGRGSLLFLLCHQRTLCGFFSGSCDSEGSRSVRYLSGVTFSGQLIWLLMTCCWSWVQLESVKSVLEYLEM